MDRDDLEVSEVIVHIVEKIKKTTLQSQLKRAAQREAEKKEVKITSIKDDIIKSLGQSGWEKILQNAVFQELHKLPTILDKSDPALNKEPLSYMRKAQSNWERRIIKSMNSMCTELSIPLGRKRPTDEQRELLQKWNEMGTDEPDLSHFRPVYAPKDFLEVISALRNENYSISDPSLVDSERSNNTHWGLIQVPLHIPSQKEMQKKFKQLAPEYSQTGVDDSAEVLTESYLSERVKQAKKVLNDNQSAVACYFLRQGCPTGCRGELWQLALGVTINHLDILHYEQLKGYVLQHDLLVDSLIYKDVKLSATNDDYYFVFEDFLYQVLLIFSRDVTILNIFSSSSATPPKSFIRVADVEAFKLSQLAENEEGIETSAEVISPAKEIAKTVTCKPECYVAFYRHDKLCFDVRKLGQDSYSVVYPPNGVIPFHGFSMYAAPICYLYNEPVRLYHIFREMYTRFFHKLHSISSDSEGIVSLCLIFETTLQSHHPKLFYHLQTISAQPLKVAFKWLVRAFSGYLATDQLLLLWDRMIGFGSLQVLPLLAVAIFIFRSSNLMQITTSNGVEAAFADLSTLKVAPLLQLILFTKTN